MILNFWLDLDIVHKNLENKNKSVKLVFVYFLTFLVIFDGTKFNFFIIWQYSFYYNSMSSIVNFIDYVLQNGVICSPEQIKKEMSSALSDFLMRFQLVPYTLGQKSRFCLKILNDWNSNLPKSEIYFKNRLVYLNFWAKIGQNLRSFNFLFFFSFNFLFEIFGQKMVKI